LWKTIQVRGVERFRLFPDLFDRCAGVESADVEEHTAHVTSGLLHVRKRDWYPGTNLRIHKLKTSRHDPDDRAGTSIDADLTANHVRASAKQQLPQGIAENHALIVSDRGFYFVEAAAECWRNPEQTKQGRGGGHGVYTCGQTVDLDGHAVGIKRCLLAER